MPHPQARGSLQARHTTLSRAPCVSARGPEQVPYQSLEHLCQACRERCMPELVAVAYAAYWGRRHGCVLNFESMQPSLMHPLVAEIQNFEASMRERQRSGAQTKARHAGRTADER